MYFGLLFTNWDIFNWSHFPIVCIAWPWEQVRSALNEREELQVLRTKFSILQGGFSQKASKPFILTKLNISNNSLNRSA